ncbi:hypothetical protein [Lysobacter silvisoli]|uniref:YCII-related domain-containing protein n=1 Tax=Lysobacter silvisoli TaxID=2293254 RepID=A0A371K2P8_9GAMM|nr:hypothetical protein [Lysobacter silvisoli]RDZ28168.1 hypothetical protein DX914_03220 [Lysobacter silvisoli]
MKQYLAIFTGSPASMDTWKTLDPATRQAREQAGMQAWQQWVTEHAAAIVDHGAPLGTTKRIGPDGIADIRNALAAYTVVQAESHQAAAQLFENHPHFTIFPGDGVEVMECLPMPGI